MFKKLVKKPNWMSPKISFCLSQDVHLKIIDEKDEKWRKINPKRTHFRKLRRQNVCVQVKIWMSFFKFFCYLWCLFQFVLTLFHFSLFLLWQENYDVHAEFKWGAFISKVLQKQNTRFKLFKFLFLGISLSTKETNNKTK